MDGWMDGMDWYRELCFSHFHGSYFLSCLLVCLRIYLISVPNVSTIAHTRHETKTSIRTRDRKEMIMKISLSRTHLLIFYIPNDSKSYLIVFFFLLLCFSNFLSVDWYTIILSCSLCSTVLYIYTQAQTDSGLFLLRVWLGLHFHKTAWNRGFKIARCSLCLSLALFLGMKSMERKWKWKGGRNEGKKERRKKERSIWMAISSSCSSYKHA
jgi:hypothetical protein